MLPIIGHEKREEMVKQSIAYSTVSHLTVGYTSRRPAKFKHIDFKLRYTWHFILQAEFHYTNRYTIVSFNN